MRIRKDRYIKIPMGMNAVEVEIFESDIREIQKQIVAGGRLDSDSRMTIDAILSAVCTDRLVESEPE